MSSTKLKVLFIKEKRVKSGLEGTGSTLCTLCKSLVLKGIPCHILYDSNDLFLEKCQKRNLSIETYPLLKNSPKLIFSIFKLYKNKAYIKELVRDYRPTHVVLESAYLINLMPRLDIPIVLHNHAAFNDNSPLELDIKALLRLELKKFLKSFYRKYYAFSFYKFDGIINVSNSAKISSIKKYRSLPDRNLVVNNGLDLEEALSNSAHLQNKSLGPVVDLGRITKAKGVEDFCKVAKIIKEECSQISFEFYGNPNKELYGNAVREKYKEWVAFPGFSTNNLEILQEATVLLHLSEREACPNAVLESYAVGTPVIGWDVAGMRDIVEDSVTGFLAPFGDIDKVADTLKKVFKDKELRERLQIACIKRSKAYTSQAMATNFEKALLTYV